MKNKDMDKEIGIVSVRNAYGYKIKSLCASCQHKCIDNSGIRVCAEMMLNVEQNFNCDSWKMSEGLNNAGKSNGKVKRREYLIFIQEIRIAENDDIKKGIIKAKERKTVEEIRQMFTEKFGSIYAIE